MKLQGDGLGRSPDGLIGSLHGGGTLVLTNARFTGINDAAFAAAVRATDRNGAIDAPKVMAAVNAVMDNGRLMVPQGNAELTVTAGRIHLGKTVLTASGGTELAIDGVLDLNTAAVDARLTLSGQPPANALISIRPEIDVIVKGPVAAPERKLETSTLVAWLALRAAELQTRRLKSLEANQRDDLRGPIARPAAPSLRFIPMGTALETMDNRNAAALTGPAGKSFDRLRPEAPPAPPASRSDRGAPAATAPAAPAATRPLVTRPVGGPDGSAPAPGTAGLDREAPQAPLPTPQSPLDLLFRSQN